MLALALPALLPPPMPFKIFVLSAGVFGFPWRRFVVPCFSRGASATPSGRSAGAVYGDDALAVLQRSDAWFARNLPVVLAVVAAADGGGGGRLAASGAGVPARPTRG